VGFGGYLPQIQDQSDAAAPGSFFNKPSSELMSYYAPQYAGITPAKWVGKGNKGGCKLWSDWCVWFACVALTRRFDNVAAATWTRLRASRTAALCVLRC